MVGQKQTFNTPDTQRKGSNKV